MARSIKSPVKAHDFSPVLDRDASHVARFVFSLLQIDVRASAAFYDGYPKPGVYVHSTCRYCQLFVFPINKQPGRFCLLRNSSCIYRRRRLKELFRPSVPRSLLVWEALINVQRLSHEMVFFPDTQIPQLNMTSSGSR